MPFSAARRKLRSTLFSLGREEVCGTRIRRAAGFGTRAACAPRRAWRHAKHNPLAKNSEPRTRNRFRGIAFYLRLSLRVLVRPTLEPRLATLRLVRTFVTVPFAMYWVQSL